MSLSFIIGKMLRWASVIVSLNIFNQNPCKPKYFQIAHEQLKEI